MSKTYIEQLIDLHLVKPGDRVCSVLGLDESRVAKENWGEGWGRVESWGHNTVGMFFVMIHYENPKKKNPWNTNAKRITEWKPAEGRTKEDECKPSA